MYTHTYIPPFGSAAIHVQSSLPSLTGGLLDNTTY